MTKLDLLSQFGTFSVGFDNVFEELNRAKHLNNPSYPPYNIVKIDDEHFVIELAIAGFGKNTAKAIKENDLKLDIKAPMKDVPSMTRAIELYIKQSNA